MAQSGVWVPLRYLAPSAASIRLVSFWTEGSPQLGGTPFWATTPLAARAMIEVEGFMV